MGRAPTKSSGPAAGKGAPDHNAFMQTGARLGPYVVIAPLGKGGMGEVYRAKDTRLGREVALKILPERSGRNPEALARFEREAQVLAALSHPNILTIFDVGSDDGRFFVVTELLSGETLRSRIARRPLRWSEALPIGIEIAEGLSAAHAAGVIHRDLKPENIVLTPDGHVKILDFGLARWSRDTDIAQVEFEPTAAPPTATGTVMGTTPYMSPEQSRGMHVDGRSDLFAWGCVMQEMLTGRSPFSRASPADTTSAILKEDPPALPGFDATIPPGLDRAVRRCLEKDPGRRFQSARDLALHLRRVQEGVSLPEGPVPAAGSGSRPGRSKAMTAAIALMVVIAGALAIYWTMGRKPAGAPVAYESLAVLPLQNLSADPEQEYFVDGMTDAVIEDLSRIKALRVISRTSVMPYRATRQPLTEIARQLKADALIEGSVMRSGDRVRISVQLIDGSSDRHLWAESYERELKDVFALQSEVARAIAQQVRAVMTPQEQERLVKTPPVDPEAYELYLKGRHIMMRGGLEDALRAIEDFQAGLAKDPDSALIYTGLADAYIHRMSDVHENPVEAIARARAAALKALQLDDSLAEAHTSLAGIKLFYDWDWAGAESELRRAMELNPGYSLAYRMYGMYLTVVGHHPEALPYFDKARALDPLQERNYLNEGYSSFMAHQYDEAIEQYRQGFAIEPDPMTYFGLVLSLAEKGDYRTSIAEAEKATKADDSPLLLTSLASAYARAGRRADASRVLDRLVELSRHQGPAPAWHGKASRYVCPYEVAGVYAQLGDKDRAFEWLDKAYRSRSCLYWLRQDPRLDSLRSDRRFEELLDKIKFPQ